nr:hypothetical protein BaRGS_028217 [Batillaria attramentaria]
MAVVCRQELEDEHEQLSEEYHKLSIENLRLRDKVDFLEQRMNSKHEQGSKPLPPTHDLQDQIRNLKNMLEEEKERSRELEQRVAARSTETAESATADTVDTDSWQDSDEELYNSAGKKTKSEGSVDEKHMVALLRSQMLTLRQENDQLRDKLQQTLPNGYRESSPYRLSGEGEKGGDVNGNDTADVQQRISTLETERQELKTELLKLKESSASQQLTGALGQEELIHSNKQLQDKVDSLTSTVATLQEEKATLQAKVEALEEEKAAIPSDKVAVMNSAKLMEEVRFDEEGFVEGQDLTKEEFLQAQNEQLKVQCGLLTEELSKLRNTFDAILKAGDNLQADYDQLQAEKDKLHDQLEVVAREKEEVMKENEFLLSDGNALHEDLKKLVHELEKMQDKYKKVCAEKDDLQNQATAVTIAGKVGEVARLLEEREKLQQRLVEAEETSGRLTHDQAILLEEVQSLQEGNTALTKERDALQAEMEDMEAMMTQHEALTQDYTQLEMDFNDLMKEKERLEQDLVNNDDGDDVTAGTSRRALEEERDLLIAERDQLELTIKELSRENAVLEEQVEALGQKSGDSDTGGANVSHLEHTVEELSKENAELEEELATMQEHMNELEVRLEAAEAGREEEEDMEALKASVAQLELTVTELSKENAQLEEELTRVREQLKVAQDALDKRLVLEGLTSSTAESTIQNLTREKENLSQQVSQLQATLHTLQDNTHVQKATLAQQDGAASVEERERLSHTVDQLERENKRLVSELDSVKARLAGDSQDVAAKVTSLPGASRTVMNSLNGHEAEDKNGEHQDGATPDEMKALKAEAERLHRQLMGHMDQDVKEALHSIIEMRSMEQFC